jgi:hypothetical protein
MFRVLVLVVVGLSKYDSRLKAIAVVQNDTTQALSIPASAIAYPQQPLFGTAVFDQMSGEFGDAQRLATLIEVCNTRHEASVGIDVLVVIVFLVRQGDYNTDRRRRDLLRRRIVLRWSFWLLLIAPTSTTAYRRHGKKDEDQSPMLSLADHVTCSLLGFVKVVSRRRAIDTATSATAKRNFFHGTAK